MTRPTRQQAARVFVLIVIVVCVSRTDVWEIAYKLMIVVLHATRECLDEPPKPAKLMELAKEGMFDLIKK